MWKYFSSAFVSMVAYVIAIISGFSLYNIIYEVPFDLNRPASGIIIGSVVVIITYVMLGVFIGFIFKKEQVKYSFLIGLLVVIGERVSLYFIGWNFVKTRVDGWSYESILSPVQFVWAEALPYFTPFYIVMAGICSLLVCMISTWGIGRFSTFSDKTI